MIRTGGRHVRILSRFILFRHFRCMRCGLLDLAIVVGGVILGLFQFYKRQIDN